ncbi:hypothetical protein AWB68_02439 [Caballeronia choica]|uniref:Uncharacterized protein n=1 Tax=Caballeronia choica TaxID=326476 RepID=A0A158HZ21_9BURK|nr:hypothetical protein AWB68_02439 [Caballeronia choica]
MTPVFAHPQPESRVLFYAHGMRDVLLRRAPLRLVQQLFGAVDHLGRAKGFVYLA